MKIVFLGLMFCEESLREAYKCSKGGIQVATHVFQTNLLNGFKSHDEIDIKVYNIPPIGSFFINYKKLFSSKYIWGENNLQFGFVNIPIIKHLQQMLQLRYRLEKEIKKDSNLYIIIYSLYTPYMLVVNSLKKKYPNITVGLIQTDAILGHEDMEKHMSVINVIRGKIHIALAKKIDVFILLTKYLREAMEIENAPSIIVECVCDDFQEPNKINETSRNVCLYTGVTDYVYGIKELVEAFKEIEDAELWICGTGDADDYLKKCSETYSNIKFYGFVNKDIVSEYREQCDFLINPRQPSGTYTKYSFPSKTIEYMMSGKPCIMYKLEGIPDEYDQYLNYLRGTRSCQIMEELKEIFGKDYSCLVDKAKRARDFVRENKSAKKQALRIIELMKKRGN